MKMARNQRHVVPSKRGWSVKKPNADRASSNHTTQSAAQAAAKRIVGRTGGGEVVIHDRHGRIRDSDTVAPGNDPHPPTDTRH
ncbi:MAG: DUF2188 domain-containing protein [Dehalococcoidia bacterium]